MSIPPNKDLVVALIVLYDSEHRFLLQHRTENAKRLPGYWAFFGGEIESGETPEAAIIRETKEELNYSLNSPALIYEQDFNLQNSTGYMYVFTERFFENKNQLVLNEGQDLGWFNLEESKQLKMIEHDRRVLRELDQKLTAL